MQGRERVDEIRGQRFSPRAFHRLPLRTPGERRVPFDFLADKERRAENCGVVACEEHPRRRDGACAQGAQGLKFRHRTVRREEAVRRTDPQNDLARPREAGDPRGVGDPGESGREFAELFDRDFASARRGKELRQSLPKPVPILEGGRFRRPGSLRFPHCDDLADYGRQAPIQFNKLPHHLPPINAQRFQGG